MSSIAQLDGSQYRAVVALRYLDACKAICAVSDTDKHRIGLALKEHVNG